MYSWGEVVSGFRLRSPLFVHVLFSVVVLPISHDTLLPSPQDLTPAPFELI